MTALGITTRTTVRNLDRFVLVGRKGLHAVAPAWATTSRIELEREWYQ